MKNFINWQPMSTVPKDGTPVLLVARQQYLMIAVWNGAKKIWEHPELGTWLQENTPIAWAKAPLLPKGSYGLSLD